MTVTIRFQFPLGRYHATPWGRQVNESATEWPPSPWRILRALYATWRWRVPELDEAAVLSTLSALTDPPSYQLPRYGTGHTRHYMPDFDHGPTTSTDKVLDPFLALPRNAEVVVRWPCTLGPSGRAALAHLCAALPYLGRTESICSARVVDDGDGSSDGPWVEPGAPVALAERPVRVLIPTPPLDTRALLSRTTAVRRQGRTTPPGSRWVSYRVPSSAPPLSRPRPLRPSAQPVEAVVFRLQGPALPGVGDTVVYADRLRAAAQCKFGTPSSPTLSGRPAREGTGELVDPTDPQYRRRDGHQHAHYLVIDDDGDRLLDTAIVWAPEGLAEDVVVALFDVDRLFTGHPAFRPLRVAAVSAGKARDVFPEQLISNSATWSTVTPFLLFRHPKRHQSIEELIASEVRRELNDRHLPAAAVEVLRGDWLSFRRVRRLGDPQSGRAFGLRLHFEEPLAVPSPIVIGGLSHFGMGLFKAA